MTSPLGANLQYSRNGTTWQGSTTFSGLTANTTYTISVRSTVNPTCISTSSFVVNAVPSPPAVPSATLTQPTCALTTGTIVVTSPLGTNLQYSRNGTTWQGSTTFSGLTANTTYTISVRSSVSPTCISTSSFVVNAIPSPPAAPAATLTQPTCTLSTGTIVVTSPLGTNLQYSANGTTWQSSTTFSALTANTTYTIRVRSSVNPTCISTANFVINAVPNAPAVPAATLVQPTCSVTSGTIIINTPLGAGLQYSKNGTTWQSSATFNGLTANTTYTISVRSAVNPTCISTSNFVINGVPDQPTPPNVGLILQPSCSTATGSVELSGLPAGNWTLYPGAISGNGPEAIISGLTANTYLYTVVNSMGCTSSGSVAVIINSQPVTPVAPTFVTVIQPTCATVSGTLALSDLPATGNWTLTRIQDGSIRIGNGTDITISGLPADTYSFTVTGADGCISHASDQIILKNATSPSAILTAITSETCGAANGVLSLGVVTGGNPPYSYSVDGSIFSQITKYTNLASGPHTIDVRDNNLCSFSTIATILNLGGPTAIAIQVTDETCGAGNGVLALGAVTGGTPPYSFSLDGSDFTQTTNYTNLTAGSHTINVKDNNDCNYLTTAVLQNISGPKAIETQITGATCGASNGELNLGTVTGGSSPFTYSVDGSSFAETTHYTDLSAGSHTIDVKDKNGCDFSNAVTIAQSPATSATIKGDTAICAGSPVPIIIEMTGTAPWSIIYTDGETSVPLNNILSSPYRFNVSPTTNTTYTLTSVTDANCTGTTSGSAIIAVTARVLPTFTQPGPFLINTVPPLLPGFSLNGISGIWSPSAISTASSGTSTYTFIPDPNECASKTSVSITINIQAVIAEKDSLPGSSVIHSGACQPISLDGSKSIGNIVSYDWSLLDTGGSLTQKSGVTTDFMLSGDYAGSLPADFRIRLFVTDNKGNSSSDTIAIQVDRLPVAGVTSSGTLQKDGSMIVDGSVSIGTDITYQWSTSEGKIVGPNNAPTARFIGAGMYRLKITDIYGCQSIKDFKFPLEVYRIVANPDYYRITWAQDTALNVLANDTLPPGYNSIRVIKQPNLGKTSVNSDLTITYSPTTRKPGHDQFEYEVCNIELCDTATVTIDIFDSQLFIPQGFSPNGDGVNDLLRFDGLDKYKPSELTVYTRSGQQVFSSSDYLNDWDGRMSNHQLVPTGVYYYVLKLGQTNRIIKGFIYIGY